MVIAVPHTKKIHLFIQQFGPKADSSLKDLTVDRTNTFTQSLGITKGRTKRIKCETETTSEQDTRITKVKGNLHSIYIQNCVGFLFLINQSKLLGQIFPQRLDSVARVVQESRNTQPLYRLCCLHFANSRFKTGNDRSS